MKPVLIALLFSLTLTVFLRLKARRIGSNKFKQTSLIVLLISIIYFLLVILATFIGAESTPVWVTTTNHLDKKLTPYNIVIYDHPIYNDLSRFVYRGRALDVWDSSTTRIEYDGAIEFWTIALDDFNNIVFFDITNSHSDNEFDFKIDKSYIKDQYKVTLASSDIKIYNTDKLTNDILITIDIILIIILLIEILTSKQKFNNSLDNTEQDKW